MRRSAIVAVAAIALSACNEGAPTLDASSDEALKASIQRMAEHLPEDKKQSLSKAVMALTFGEAVNSGGLIGAAEAAKAPNFMSTAAAPLKGKTADEIIKIADGRIAERRQRQLEAVNTEISALQSEISGDDTTISNAKSLIEKIAISGSRFYINDAGYISEPAISFQIQNNGAIAIKRIFARGILETPGRSVPWVDDEFNYEIPGGIEPGEKKTLRLAPNQFSGWGNSEITKRKDLVLTVSVVDFEKPDGSRVIGAVDKTIKQKKEKLDILMKQRETLLSSAH